MKAGEMNKSIREMDYKQSLDAAMEYILAVFGVPKAVVGLVRDTNRANMQGALMAFADNTINPLLVAIGQSLTLSLGHEYDKRIKIWFDPVTVEDMEQMRKNIDTAQKTGSVSPNEVREQLLSLGSFERGGDTPLVNQNMVPAPQGNEADEDLISESPKKEPKKDTDELTVTVDEQTGEQKTGELTGTTETKDTEKRDIASIRVSPLRS